MSQAELTVGSNHETSGTLKVSDVFFSKKGLHVGDRFSVTCDQCPTGFDTYVNRKDLSTLYCPSLPRSIDIPTLKRLGGDRVILTNIKVTRIP